MGRAYLGDGVYVDNDQHVRGCVVLTTSDGIRATNTIVLEPEVIEAFLAFVLTPAGLAALREAARVNRKAATEPPR